jgi:hypothetical protein
MILGSEVREERRRRVAAPATSCQDGQQGRSSLGGACDIACVCERLLVENLDGERVQAAGAHAREVLAGAPLDDGGVAPRQHQPGRTPADDHHRMPVHRHTPAQLSRLALSSLQASIARGGGEKHRSSDRCVRGLDALQ